MLVDQISFSVLTAIFFSITIFAKFKEFLHKSTFISTSNQTNSNQNDSYQKQPKKSAEKFKLLKTTVNSYAAFNSVVICIGFISETYLLGGRLLLNMLSVSIGYIIAFLILHPVMYSLDKEIKSPYEYLYYRYGSQLIMRIIPALSGIFFYLLFMALHLWGCTIILSTILPVPYLFVSSIVIGVFGTMGSIFKGFNQSIKMNLIQLFLLLSGLIAALVITFSSNPNNKTAQELWDLADQFGRRNFIEPSGDFTVRYTIWNQAFSLPIPWITVHILMQPSFTKYRTIKGKTQSRFILLSHLPVVWLINSLFVFCGIAAFCFYLSNDPISGQRVKNKNQIAPLWIIESCDLYLPSLAGLCLASLFANGIQVYSIGIWSCSNSFLEDVMGKIIKKKSKFYKTLFCILFGGLTIGFSILFQYAKNTILSLFFVFSNSLNSPILGLFLLSVLNSKANCVGAIMAFIINVGINIWLALSSLAFSNLKSQEYGPLVINNQTYSITNATMSGDYYPTNSVLFYLYSISSIWYCLFSLLFNVILGSLFSFIYSLLKSKSFDADQSFKEMRKKYLFKSEYLFIRK